MNTATTVILHKAAQDSLFSLPSVLTAPSSQAEVFSAAMYKKQRMCFFIFFMSKSTLYKTSSALSAGIKGLLCEWYCYHQTWPQGKHGPAPICQQPPASFSSSFYHPWHTHPSDKKLNQLLNQRQCKNIEILVTIECYINQLSFTVTSSSQYTMKWATWITRPLFIFPARCQPT